MTLWHRNKTFLAIIPGIPDGEECYNISVEGKADLPESSWLNIWYHELYHRSSLRCPRIDYHQTHPKSFYLRLPRQHWLVLQIQELLLKWIRKRKLSYLYFQITGKWRIILLNTYLINKLSFFFKMYEDKKFSQDNLETLKCKENQRQERHLNENIF